MILKKISITSTGTWGFINKGECKYPSRVSERRGPLLPIVVFSRLLRLLLSFFLLFFVSTLDASLFWMDAYETGLETLGR